MKSEEGKVMADKVKKAIEEFCSDRGLELVKRYSGRCMYGNTCYGIVCDDINTLLYLSDYLRNNGIKSVASALGNVEIDNMGYQKIIYFRNVSLESREVV